MTSVEPKPVQTEKSFEYLMYPSESGRYCSVQFRIHVLTTQNQGMLFRIRVRLTCGSKFLELWTDSIKVVAKLDSIRKKQAEREGAPIVSRKNKRARADDLLESLASIQEQQRYQAQLLNNLLGRMSSPEHSCSLTSTVSPPHSPVHGNRSPHSAHSPPVALTPARTPASPTSNGDPLEAAFSQFMQVYSQQDVEERPKKMRKIISSLVPEPCAKEIKELGCVLADFSDSQSNEDPVLMEQSSNSSLANSSSELRSFLAESNFDITGSNFGIANGATEAELESWSSLLHEYLTKDA